MKIIDSGEEVARRVKYLLEKNGLLNNKVRPEYEYFTSDKRGKIIKVNFDGINR